MFYPKPDSCTAAVLSRLGCGRGVVTLPCWPGPVIASLVVPNQQSKGYSSCSILTGGIGIYYVQWLTCWNDWLAACGTWPMQTLVVPTETDREATVWVVVCPPYNARVISPNSNREKQLVGSFIFYRRTGEVIIESQSSGRSNHAPSLLSNVPVLGSSVGQFYQLLGRQDVTMSKFLWTIGTIFFSAFLHLHLCSLCTKGLFCLYYCHTETLPWVKPGASHNQANCCYWATEAFGDRLNYLTQLGLCYNETIIKFSLSSAWWG